MLTYLLEVTISWTLLYSVFYLFLRKLTFFEINRWYLLSAMTLGLAFPVLKIVALELWSDNSSQLAIAVNHVQQLPYHVVNNLTIEENNTTAIGYFILKLLYVLGLSFFIARFIKGILSIKKIYDQGEHEIYDHYQIIRTKEEHLPFSFFNNIFISTLTPLNDEYRQILKHELEHIKNWHTIDVIVMEIINIIFWFHPMIYLYKTALRQTHEYLADAAVLQDTPRKMYGHILLRQSLSGIQIALAHSFFHSHIKNRINMMYQKKSGRSAWLKYSLAIPVLAILTIAFISKRTINDNLINDDALIENELNITNDSIEKPSITVGEYLDLDFLGSDIYLNGKKVIPPLKNYIDLSKEQISAIHFVENPALYDQSHPDYIPNRKQIYVSTITGSMKSDDPLPKSTTEFSKEINVPDEYPLFGDCLTKACSDQQLIAYIKSNLKYPQEAKKLGLEGRVYIGFIVEKDGSASSIKILKDLGGGLGQAASDLVANMSKQNKKWIPGKINGELARVNYVLPITFELEKDNSTLEAEELFKIVEQMPLFGGCTTKKCSDEKLIDYLYKNLKYPALARKEKVEGRVYIQFVVEKDGSISNINTVRDIGSGCGEAGENVLKQMNIDGPLWTAGKQQGQDVRVLYTLPITFRLEEKESLVSNHTDSPSTNSKNDPAVTSTSTSDSEVQEIFKVVEQMPLFGGCTTKECSDEKLMNFISTNLKYPSEAQENKIEGRVFLQFVINKSGYVEQTNIIRDIGGGCGEAAKEMIAQMNAEGPSWTPGLQRGVKVNVKYTLPVTFKNTNLTQNNNEIEKPLFVIDGVIPLIVIDGVIETDKTLTDIAPDRIESVNVLKGQNAITKYGDKGKNGVIEVITKPANDESLEILKNTMNLSAAAFNNRITGKIVDENGNPLIGANIVVNNTMTGTVSGIDGSFELVLPEGHKTITASFVGFESKSKTFDISSWDAQSEKGNMQVSPTGDKPDPLFVIDGVIVEKKFTDLNPDDVKSIHVLKGESATEKYGDKGKNGAIEITLKDGKKASYINKDQHVFDIADFNQYPIDSDPSLKITKVGLDEIEFELKNSEKGEVTVVLFDNTGRILKNERFQKESTLQSLKGRLDASELNTGIYYLSTTIGASRSNTKFSFIK